MILIFKRSQAFAPDCDICEADSKAGWCNFWVCLAQKPCSRHVPQGGKFVK